MTFSHQRQEDNAMKAKIIENRRHIKNIITRGKDQNSFKLSENIESRNAKNQAVSSKYWSAGDLIKLNLNQDMTNSSIRRFHETTWINESQNFALVSDSKSNNKAKATVFAKPPLISKMKLERNVDAKNLLYVNFALALKRLCEVDILFGLSTISWPIRK